MRIAIAQMNPRVGDLHNNLAHALGAAQAAAAKDADIIVFPAYVLTGAPLDGLADSSSFLADSRDQLNTFAQSCPIPAFVSALNIITDEDGDTAVLPELFFVNDGEYESLGIPALDEDENCLAVEVDDLTFALLLENHFAEQTETTEVDVMIEMVADAFGESCAAEAAWGCLDRTRLLAKNCHSWVLNVNLCGAADQMVFSGNSTVTAPNGKIFHACTLEDEELFIFDTTLSQDLKFPDPANYQMAPDAIIWTALVSATRDYVLKNEFSDVIVGVSGGIDSAVVATIAVDALGSDHVHALLMPGKYTADDSGQDARALVKTLDIDSIEVPIDDCVRACCIALADACGGAVEGLAAENLQARIRGVYLMTISNARSWLVLNTGNKSEAAMGFSTLYGDTVGSFAPIGDIYKSDVYDLARWRMEQGACIPDNSLVKEPSAELYEGAKDSDRLPPYDELDDLLFDHVEGSMGAAELRGEGHDANMVTDVLRRVVGTEFKRRQEPIAPKVEGVSFSERAWPITNAWHDRS